MAFFARSLCFTLSTWFKMFRGHARTRVSGGLLRNSLFRNLHLSQVLAHGRYKKQAAFSHFHLIGGLTGNRSVASHLQSSSAESSHAL